MDAHVAAGVAAADLRAVVVWVPLAFVALMLAWYVRSAMALGSIARESLVPAGYGGRYAAAVLDDLEQWRPELLLFYDAYGANLANVYHDQGRLEEAAEHYESAIQLNSKFVAAHRNLGAPSTHDSDAGGGASLSKDYHGMGDNGGVSHTALA